MWLNWSAKVIMWFSKSSYSFFTISMRVMSSSFLPLRMAIASSLVFSAWTLLPKSMTAPASAGMSAIIWTPAPNGTITPSAPSSEMPSRASIACVCSTLRLSRFRICCSMACKRSRLASTNLARRCNSAPSPIVMGASTMPSVKKPSQIDLPDQALLAIGRPICLLES